MSTFIQHTQYITTICYIWTARKAMKKVQKTVSFGKIFVALILGSMHYMLLMQINYRNDAFQLKQIRII